MYRNESIRAQLYRNKRTRAHFFSVQPQRRLWSSLYSPAHALLLWYMICILSPSVLRACSKTALFGFIYLILCKIEQGLGFDGPAGNYILFILNLLVFCICWRLRETLYIMAIYLIVYARALPMYLLFRLSNFYVDKPHRF